MCAVAVVARRRSEGTHPINKTTRVTIEFNREKNGFQSTKRARGGASGREGIPEVNPRARMRHYCLLFRTSIPNGWRSAGTPARGRERARARETGRKTVFANDSTTPSEFDFFVEVNDTDFVSFFLKTIRKAQLRSQDSTGR